jgi:hypothetical protein
MPGIFGLSLLEVDISEVLRFSLFQRRNTRTASEMVQLSLLKSPHQTGFTSSVVSHLQRNTSDTHHEENRIPPAKDYCTLRSFVF